MKVYHVRSECPVEMPMYSRTQFSWLLSTMSQRTLHYSEYMYVCCIDKKNHSKNHDCVYFTMPRNSLMLRDFETYRCFRNALLRFRSAFRHWSWCIQKIHHRRLPQLFWRWHVYLYGVSENLNLESVWELFFFSQTQTRSEAAGAKVCAKISICVGWYRCGVSAKWYDKHLCSACVVEASKRNR